MLDVVRGWILSLTGTALLASAALALAPEGGVKRVLKMLCGFALMAALLSLVTDLDTGGIAVALARYRDKADSLTQSAVSAGADQTRFIIERECEAYILDKATELGVQLRGVEVTVQWSADGFWYPAKAEIEGDESTELARIVEADLGISRTNQIWSTDDEA